jgi:hypothetical protein
VIEAQMHKDRRYLIDYLMQARPPAPEDRKRVQQAYERYPTQLLAETAEALSQGLRLTVDVVAETPEQQVALAQDIASCRQHRREAYGDGRQPYAYRVEPIYPRDPNKEMLVTAAVMTCMATGRMLDGMGGGGQFLAPEIVDGLRNQGVGKSVVYNADWDGALAALRRIVAIGGEAAKIAQAALDQIGD